MWSTKASCRGQTQITVNDGVIVVTQGVQTTSSFASPLPVQPNIQYDHFGIVMHCAVQMTLSYPPFPLHSSEYGSTFTGVLVCRDSLTVLLFAQ